jgi:hypothetical protein
MRCTHVVVVAMALMTAIPLPAVAQSRASRADAQVRVFEGPN